MRKKVDITTIKGNLKEVRKYIGGLFVMLQAQINGKKVICPYCHEEFRCYSEDEYFCTKCRKVFFAYY